MNSYHVMFAQNRLRSGDTGQIRLSEAAGGHGPAACMVEESQSSRHPGRALPSRKYYFTVRLCCQGLEALAAISFSMCLHGVPLKPTHA